MKILLAPLFFRSRMCKHCLRNFYKKYPDRWIGLHEFESLPPLGSFDVSRGFIPDFPTLLMFEEFMLDGEALERLQSPGKRTWLSEWSELVDALSSEGALQVVDVATAAGQSPHKRGAMLRRDLAQPDHWWHAMGFYDAVTSRASKFLGDSPRQAQSFAWEFDPDAAPGVQGPDGEFHNLAVVLSEAGQSKMPAHRSMYETALDALKGHLREVNSCLTACDYLEAAPFMWAPYRRYLQEKLPFTAASDSEATGSAGRQFFNVAFPAYSPTTVRDFAKLRSDKRIKALREEILGASRDGRLLDPTYPQRVLDEILKLQHEHMRIRRIAGWIASAVGTIPIPGLGLAASGVSEATTTLLERKKRKPWHWFYLISDGRGAT